MEDSKLTTPAATETEVARLAGMLARLFRDRVDGYVTDMRLPLDDAVALQGNINRHELERLERTDLPSVTWDQLTAAAALDPDQAMAVWERMKAEAIAALADGSRAADLLGTSLMPNARARFFAQLAAMRDDFQPRSGIEAALVDAAALAFWEHLMWLGHAHFLAANEAQEQRQSVESRSAWELPRVTAMEARREAVEMADRYHRMFLRNVRALRDFRRSGSAVMVQNAGQVNVGAQQVNVGAR